MSIKISALPAGSPIQGGELIPMVQDNGTFYTTAAALLQPVAPAYSVYSALLTQSGTAAPTIVVMQNTTGRTFSIARIAAGTYQITISGGALVNDKFWAQVSPGIAGTGLFVNVYKQGIEFNLIVVFTSSSTLSGVDDVLLDTPLEIRIYN